MNAFTLREAEHWTEAKLFPVFDNQIGIEPSPFVEKIKKVPLDAPKISANTPIGANGGVGFGSEDANIPESGAMLYDRFNLPVKALFGNLELSDMALTLGTGDKSIKSILKEQTVSVKDTMSFVLAHSIISGNGTGKICNVTAASSTDTFTVSDMRGLREGLKIDFYANGGSTPAHAKKRIKSMNRKDKTITIEGDPFTVADGFITYQGSYNKSITGIDAIFDDSVTHLYGIEKADKSWIKPDVDTVSGMAEIDTKLRQMTQASEWYKGGKIDIMLAGDEAYAAYVDYLKTAKVYPVERQHFQGGVSAIEVLFGNRAVAFVNEQHVKSDEIIGLDTSTFEMPITPVKFLKQSDGSAFQRVDHSSIWQAVMGIYTNVICKKPGAQFKLTGVTRS